jgi:hypothetical protein
MLRPDSSFLPFSSDCAASSQLLSVKAFLYVSVCLRLQAHLLQCSLYGYGEIEKAIVKEVMMGLVIGILVVVILVIVIMRLT